MKTNAKLIPGVICIAVLLASGVSMYADVANVVLGFDENNSKNLCPNGPTPGGNCWALVGADPSIGFSGYFAYFFPAGFTVTAGDVKVLEPGAATGTLSDGLRFTDATGSIGPAVHADRMFYYSDQSDGIDAVADTGFPTNFYASGNRQTITEVGLPLCDGKYTEQFNGFCYTPAAGQPGYHAVVPIEYKGISDEPESGTPVELALGPCGVLLCGILLRKRLVLS